MGHNIHLTDIERFKAGGEVRKLRKAVQYRGAWESSSRGRRLGSSAQRPDRPRPS
jgi:hypothetical protein